MDTVRRRAGSLAALGSWLVAVLLLVGCAGTRVEPWESNSGPYDVLTPGELSELAAARAEFDAGRPREARERLLALLAERPRNLFVATLLQDVELELLRTGRDLPELDTALAASTLTDDGAPAVRLRRWYRLRADGGPKNAFDLVLAARVEGDSPAALRLLDSAIEADANCIWAHFGRAYVLLREGDLEQCRLSLARAVDLDAGHPRVRRLEATLLERLGEVKAARRLLTEWVERVAEDPRVSAGDVVDSRLDLVNADLVDGRTAAALEQLDDIETEDPSRRARALLLRAAALAELERHEESIEAALESRFYAPGDFRSHVQEAIVLQDGLADLEGALEAWRTAVELAATLAPTDGAAAIALQRARIEVERLEDQLHPSDASLLPER
ncbi:tetratricopeptide repeat protein [Rohdeia mirabilis]|uniref:tetratricopeptide repeat protein n=1 Tax=Rohdeia mirabilis TaxID=2528008 RepID=UPI003AF35FCF